MKKLLLLVLLLGGFTAFSQGTITGKVMDLDSGDPMLGANVIETGTANGAVTDIDGNFSLNVGTNTGSVTISYLGYANRNVSFDVSNADLGTISLASDANALGEVIIVGSGVIDLAEDRSTPVAVSTIKADEIQRKAVGNVEITEALKSTPSVSISQQTGFGDGQLFMRGFDNSNIAVLLNGQPVNSVEDGRIFWSNWSGVSDIANAIQVQRGLGSSKLAISSVGGTMNIVMKAADKKKGGYVRFLGGNDSYFKGTAAYNTGVSEKGWAFSVLLDHWQAHRKWAKGTYGQGQNYFVAVGYKPNETHAFNFLVTGAPQLHGQKWSQNREITAADPKYNQHWGYTSDGIESERQNFYHKPVMNLNWDWNMGDKTALGTVAYASWGRGGGTGPRGDRAARFDSPNPEAGLLGQIDYPTSIANNMLIGQGDNDADSGSRGYIRRASMNNHQWFGLISSLDHEFSDNFSANIGVDVRSYTGDHFRQVTDLYGLTGWANDTANGSVVTNEYEPDPWSSLFDFAEEGERIDYDYSETINNLGGFGQVEYATDSFSAFFQGALSSQSYEREGRYQDPGTSEKITKTGYNVKGGLSYTIEGAHKLFVNVGYYSRQPYLDNIFTNIRTSNNIISPEVDNEIIRGFEGGYHLELNNFRANVNAYVTDWDNRTQTSTGEEDPDGIPDSGDEFITTELARGVRQYHTGAELDLSYRAFDWLTINGFVSSGSWVYKGESDVSVYRDDNGELIDVTDGVNREGVKVSTAPQFTAGGGFLARVCDGLSFDGNINYQQNHYEFTSATTSIVGYEGNQLDGYELVDAGVSYKFKLGDQRIILRGNVFNVFDNVYLQDSDRFGVFPTNGRTYNGSIKYQF